MLKKTITDNNKTRKEVTYIKIRYSVLANIELVEKIFIKYLLANSISKIWYLRAGIRTWEITIWFRTFKWPWCGMRCRRSRHFKNRVGNKGTIVKEFKITMIERSTSNYLGK
jgi:hypothetical protein